MKPCTFFRIVPRSVFDPFLVTVLYLISGLFGCVCFSNVEMNFRFSLFEGKELKRLS